MSGGPTVEFRVQRLIPGDPLLRERDDRLESLKAVVGKLAHDFNNFLVPLLGYVSLIKEEVPQESPALQYANTLEMSARKTETYIDSILLGMRPHRQFAPREVQFDALVGEAIAKWHAGMTSTNRIVISQKLNPVKITLDERHWNNAIEALLSNARYALATGGPMEVKLETALLSPPERLRLGIKNPEVAILTVRDEGFGMTEEVLRRAFEPFFTTRTSVKAPGLGLTVVHSVAQHQGGQVELDTAPDQGTTARVYIPLTPISWSRAPEKVPVSLGHAKKRILLVEDDPLVREVVRTTLQSATREILVAQDAPEALKTFQRGRNEWALVISDVSLPGTSGVQMWEKMTATLPNLKFLFMTGDDSFTISSLPETKAEGHPMLIRKPFTLKSLEDAVDRLLGDPTQR